MNKLEINDFGGTSKMATSSIAIADLPLACELDREALKLIRGGRINLIVGTKEEVVERNGGSLNNIYGDAVGSWGHYRSL